MDKKTSIVVIVVIIVIIASISYFTLGNDQDIESDNSNVSSNLLPKPVLNAPETAYFGDSIKFDASKSYDEDGAVTSFKWDFGDEETIEGATVDHVYNFDNNFSIEYPLIYLVILIIWDDDGFWNSTFHEIKLFPKKYTFYLSHTELSIEKPSSDYDAIKASFGKIIPISQLTYELTESVKILPSSWNMTIYIKKPSLTILNRISLAIYNKTGKEIANVESTLKSLKLWKEKTVLIEGTTIKTEEFKSIKMTVYGFSLRKNIEMLYGGNKASNICFDFS